MKVSKINFKNLHKDAFLQFHIDFRNLINTHGSSSLKSTYLPLYKKVDDIILRKAHNELDKAYNAIAERINALIFLNDVAVYETFVKAFNAVAAKYVKSTSISHK
jgi:transcription initiation factor IIE alpha subunit